MKYLPMIFFTLSCLATGQEANRVWTSNDGQKLIGRFRAKTETHVELQLANGKSVKVAVARLSKADLDFIAENHADKNPAVSAKVVATGNPNAGNDPGRRVLEVSVDRLKGRLCSVVVLWIGEDGKTRKTGIFKAQECAALQDGKFKFEAKFGSDDPGADFSGSFQGFVVGLAEENVSKKDGASPWIASFASDKKFLKFLDEEWHAKLTR